ncbi:MAG: ABC transporter permease [Lachnospiraceae bacterium]|nr:ABC transporter permease [Lachnospiraceae bacterium]
MTTIASVLTTGKLAIIEPVEGVTIDPALNTAIETAVASGAESFEENGTEYTVLKSGKKFAIATAQPVALATTLVYDAYDSADSSFVGSYAFKYACLEAYSQGLTSFEVDGKTFKLEIDDEKSLIYNDAGKEFASISDIIVETAASDITLSLDFKTAVRDAVSSKANEFTVPGSDQKYIVNRVNTNYYIKTDTAAELIRMYEAPSSEHILGLDGNGMDVLTRLMYGGRVSLLVGFVVVFIELFIGIIVGGISGYFGGVVDTLLMRFVDLFNSIPFYPVAIILGSVMDSLEVSSMGRIFFLMMILGVLGWTGIARTVRGQILSLREQEFMVATEATGIRVSRRIFKHLVPNVMPLLIVQATMGLGGIIIAEATLSFLGLGVKYPLASWGSIINAANDIHVMTNYWFIWIPAGLLIIITVLGFNFVGDGLRDAFDPKMKR